MGVFLATGQGDILFKKHNLGVSSLRWVISEVILCVLHESPLMLWKPLSLRRSRKLIGCCHDCRSKKYIYILLALGRTGWEWFWQAALRPRSVFPWQRMCGDRQRGGVWAVSGRLHRRRLQLWRCRWGMHVCLSIWLPSLFMQVPMLVFVFAGTATYYPELW